MMDRTYAKYRTLYLIGACKHTRLIPTSKLSCKPHKGVAEAGLCQQDGCWHPQNHGMHLPFLATLPVDYGLYKIGLGAKYAELTGQAAAAIGSQNSCAKVSIIGCLCSLLKSGIGT